VGRTLFHETGFSKDEKAQKIRRKEFISTAASLCEQNSRGQKIFASNTACMRGLIAVLLFLSALHSQAQTCTAPGQNPSTAFPVCGTATFVQTSVPLCGGRKMPFKGCGNDGLTDINPFWYKFTCYQAGTLGFLITPNNNGDDYDWELYDVTGHDPNDVYTDGSLVVSNNWSGETGLTGASSAGTQTFVCGGTGKPLFSKMPLLTVGRDYLLLISHFTNSQSGYKLSFGGGTAVITDPTEPHLGKVDASCGGDVLHLKLSKKMKCASITANGTEFYITPSAATVVSGTGIGCSAQFDTDSLDIKLATFLAPGSYVLHIQKGGDGNTLLDYCDRAVAESETLPFTVYPKAPTPMDSMAALACASSELTLLFRRPMLCSSIAADGSDFSITGAYAVTVSGAKGRCTNGASKEVTVSLSQPLRVAGNFQLVLKRGGDGNTLLDECGEETPAGSALNFSVKDTVNADFTYTIGYGCAKDSVSFFHPAANGVNSWTWTLDEGQNSLQQNPQALYAVFNTPKHVTLSVGNGFCRDSSEQTITLENYLKADFDVYEDNCPNEPVPFSGKAVGKLAAHNWDFGDGAVGSGASPSHVYAGPVRQTTYNVRYTVTDSFGCKSTAQHPVNIYPSCYLAVPTAFTPNGDGLNDYFGVANAVKAENLEFIVFNRWGQVVFKTGNWKQSWDGKMNGMPQPTSVYVWFLRYTDRDTKQQRQQKGTVTLIR
jgi:gliding motility-associated-like protein